MNPAYVYLQIYRMFDHCTPLRVDCGELCGSACCKGDDCGMYLFPGEEEVYKLLPPERISVEKSDFSYTDNGITHYVPLAMCSGSCDRYERPLACRIFPLTPYIDGSGQLTVIIDPRAKRLCPLAKAFCIEDFEREFVKKIHNTFLLLTKNRRIRSFMREYSLYLEEFMRFYK